MLEALRNSVGSFAVKILLGLLILSFAAWGVGDMLRNFGGNAVVTVGGVDITPQDYQRRFSRALGQLSLQFRQRISPAVGRSLGLDQRVLAELLVEAHARKLGLGYSEEATIADIHGSPLFAGADGSFNPATFREIAQFLGLNEQGVVHYERLETIRNQLVTTIASGEAAPAVLIDAFNRYQGEKRRIEYFVLPIEKAGTVAEPDEAALKQYYEGHKTDYAAPEYRTIHVALATPQTVGPSIEVSDEEVKAFYETNKASFGTPERRHVLQLTFPDKAAADAASAELAAGKDFMEVAKAAGRTEADVDRGLISRDKLLDPAVAEAAFSLKKDEVSKPVEGSLSTSIVKVTEIEPAVTKTLDEVKDSIRTNLQQDRAGRRIQDEIYKAIEDARAGGASLKDAATAAGIEQLDITVDAAGKGEDGKPVQVAADFPQIVKSAFESDVGLETDPVDLGRRGYAWIEVAAVAPAHDRPFDEVKDEIKTAYVAAEQRKSILKLAQDLTKRANEGASLKELATGAGVELQSAEPITRTTKSEALPPQLINFVFALAADGAGTVATEDGNGRIVFKVTEIIPAEPITDEARKSYASELRQQIDGDLSAQYVGALQAEYGLSINDEAFRRLAGEARQ
ncbi:MAG: peptidyl-prolyl cis-trans isomerase [Hyphomicrobiaceae bacterium]